MYSRPIKVYQGIDNPIQVKAMNQDQKPISLIGKVMTLAIQDPTNQNTIKEYAVTWTDITQGLGNAVLDKLTLDSLENRFYKLTFSVTDANNNSSPVYIDDNYGVPLDLEILPAYYDRTDLTVSKNVAISGGDLGNPL